MYVYFGVSDSKIRMLLFLSISSYLTKQINSSSFKNCIIVSLSSKLSFLYFSADELLLTEMMFNGLFNDLTAEQATALLSCFVFQENVSYFFSSGILLNSCLHSFLSSNNALFNSVAKIRHNSMRHCTFFISS